MDDKKIVELKIEEKVSSTQSDTKKQPCLHTNPILQKMLSCNMLSEKSKFKFKDLFR